MTAPSTAAAGYKKVATANGVVFIKEDGTTQYRHDGSETTGDSFKYTITDGTNSSGEATVSYDVTPVNDNAPKAENDRYRLDEGGELSGRNIIRDNDTDSDLPADTLTIASVNGTVWADLVDSDDATYTAAAGYKKVATANGVVFIKEDGTTQYRHDGSETTGDSFKYTITDGTNSSGEATVSYDVTPVNDNAPKAENDRYRLDEGGELSGRNIIRDNDTDSDLPADTLTIASVNGTVWADLADSDDATYTAAAGYKKVATANGVVFIKEDGTTQYRHDGSETTGDSFKYTITDGTNSSGEATVSYDVTPVNDNAPKAENDRYRLDEGGELSGRNIIRDNDTDSDLPADTLTIASVNGTVWADLADSDDATYTAAAGYKKVATANGVVFIREDGTTQYRHDGSETTGDSFKYTITDGTNSSGEATVSYDVTPVNDNAPKAENDRYRLEEGGELSGRNIIRDNDTDSDLPADTLTIASVNGTVWADLADSDDATYTAAAGYKKVATANGVVFIKEDGTTQYRHDGSETNGDSFKYTITDGTNSSGEATVSYDVTPVNDNAPKAENDRYRLEEGGELSGRNIIRDNDTDSDLPADTLTIASVNGTVWADLADSDDATYTAAAGYKKVTTANGVVFIKEDGTTQYRHDGSETTGDSFKYTITDGTNSSGEATVSYDVTPVNDNAPKAENDRYRLDEGGELSGRNIIRDNDTDSDLPADTLTIASVNGTVWADLVDSDDATYTAAAGYKKVATANGVVFIKEDGTTQYRHDGSETTGDSFKYTITDGTNSSGEATVSYDVTPVNDNAPKAENDRYRLEEGGELSGRNIIRDNDTDSDLPADTLTIASVNGTVWADLVDSDDATYTAAAGYKKVATANGVVFIKEDGTTQYRHDGSETTGRQLQIHHHRWHQ
ncbi:Ig-like domain-containing protein, partial [Endozoicomonas sp. ALB091]|uniref:Ig-like domain-containing protein n=1 Tax=Endozoicomonas sp. ALB091 TaxID=3403073 RepID=UPI003BB4921F